MFNYIKLKGYIFPHVETEELYLGKIHFHFLLADRSIHIDYFKLLLPKARTIVLCVKIKLLAFILWFWIINVILAR